VLPFARVPVFLTLIAFSCATLASIAQADVIVLKNGRRIVVDQAVEQNGRVSGETSAGQLSVPRSIVDHVERGGSSSLSAAARAAGSLTIAPPAAEDVPGAEEIGRSTVHDNAIDRKYIAGLDSAAAQEGTAAAGSRAALAHQAAAQFEIGRGNLDEAIANYRRAVLLAPSGTPLQLNLLLNVSYLHLRRSEFNAALDYLDRARRLAPDSPDVAKLSGWAEYGLNRLELAVAEWKRALKLRADAEVQSALEKAQKDLETESSYREGESSHFTLRYSGSAAPGLAHDVQRTLEEHFRELATELDFMPVENIGVILYTGQAFADITRAPAWVGAVNDGRIRVPVQGLTAMTSDLSRVLKHELTHSFLQQKTRGRCPVWLQEGIAQWMEGRRSGESAAMLVAVFDQKAALPLGELEGTWMNFSGDLAKWAYRWSLGVVEYIVKTGGMSDLERILDRLVAGAAGEDAVRGVVRLKYGDLEQETATYLKKTYLQ
jgi:tetratricopeptide (TPR) repeat protein